MRKQMITLRVMRRVVTLASGATLLQAGGCTLDTDTLLADVANLALNFVLNSVFV